MRFLGAVLLAACVSAPAAPPAPLAVSSEPDVCERREPKFDDSQTFALGRRKGRPRHLEPWTSDRREADFAAVDVDVSPCSEPGGELHIRVEATGRAGIGCWDDAGIELHSLHGRGVLIENEAPKLVAIEGGHGGASAPHFESAIGPWGISMRRSAPFGGNHRMMFDAVARIIPDAKPREVEMTIEVSANRHDFDRKVASSVYVTRVVKTRIRERCAGDAVERRESRPSP